MMKDNLTVHCTSTSLVKIDMSHGKAMVEDCSMDRTVHFTHKQANGHERDRRRERESGAERYIDTGRYISRARARHGENVATSATNR